MPDATIHKLTVRLIDLICEAYDDAKFGTLMFYSFPSDVVDYAGLPKIAYKEKVIETVKSVNQYGGAEYVLTLARVVRDGRDREDLRRLVKEFEAILQPAAPAPPGAAAATAGASPPHPLPPELLTSIALYDEHPNAGPLVLDLRKRFRAVPVRPLDVPGRLHLSESEGSRLAAILALEAVPDAAYLRWLSERVTVEQPFIGFTAAQALTTASFRLTIEELRRVRRVAKDASERLDALQEAEEEDTAFDAGTRRRQLDQADTLAEMRTKKGKSKLLPDDLNAFLWALVETFDPDRFDRLCRARLQTELRFLANPQDPMELIVTTVAIAARDKGWELDLVRAAKDELPDESRFGVIHSRYAPA